MNHSTNPIRQLLVSNYPSSVNVDGGAAKVYKTVLKIRISDHCPFETADTYEVVVSAADCLLGAAVASQTHGGDGRAGDADEPANSGSDINQAARSKEAVCLVQL